MTTWNNSDITKIERIYHGPLKTYIYTITGVSGDTGGTLTTTFDHLSMAVVTEQEAAAGQQSDLVWYISGKTVVVTYTDPTASHTVKIRVVGR
jgi:hypothetical protein